MTIKGYLCYSIERKEWGRLVMVESILGKYIDIVKENEKESAEDYAVYLTELDVIKSVENNGRELSSIEVNIKLRLNHQIALVKGLMVQGSILEREVRTYEELEEFVSNYENQEQELDVYGVIMGELDSIFDETLDFGYDFGYEDIDEFIDEDIYDDSENRREGESETDREHDLGTSLNDNMFVTFDEEGTIEPEDLEEPEPSNLVIRRRGSDDNVISNPPQQTNEGVYEDEEEYTEEDAEIEEYLEDNMVMMSYFGNVPQASSVVRDNEGNIRVDYAVIIGITYTSERRSVSFLAQTMEDAIGYLLSEGYEYNKNYNIFILKEQEEIVSYARVSMDIDLRGVMEDI